MNLRRLTSADVDTYAQALEWNRRTPPWFRGAEDAFGVDTLEDYLEGADDTENQIDILVNGGEALIRFRRSAEREFEVFLAAPRRSKAQIIIDAGLLLIGQMFTDGIADSIVAWINVRNRGARKVLEAVGFQQTGIRMLKGDAPKQRIHEWEHLAVKQHG